MNPVINLVYELYNKLVRYKEGFCIILQDEDGNISNRADKGRCLFIAFTFLVLIFSGCQFNSSTATRQYITSPIHKTTLDNGMELLVKESHHDPLVALSLLVKTGSASEASLSGSGISHFVEHMLFKGTSKRPTGEIEREIASLGGYINAYTTFDYTLYSIIVPSKNFDSALDIMTDVITNSSFDEKEFEKERDVILKEIKLGDDSLDSRFTKLIFSSVFLQHPYRFPVIGKEELFKKITRDDLLSYYKLRYISNNIIFGICGDVNTNEIIDKVKVAFGAFGQKNPLLPVFIKEPRQVSLRQISETADMNVARLALAYRSVDVTSHDLYALDVLSFILAGSEGSRLNRILCQDKKIAEFVTSSNVTLKDQGIFIITCLIEPQNLEWTKKEILSQIDLIKAKSVTHEELEKARNAVLSGYLFSHESVDGQIHQALIDEALTGNPDFSKIYVDNVSGLARQDIQKVAKKFLQSDQLTVVSFLPKKEKLSEKIFQKDIDVPQIKKDVLPNKLTLLLMKDNTLPVVSVNVALKAGLRAEDAAKNGLSNFTADLLLGSTKTKSKKALVDEFELLGASFSSYSGNDTINISLKFLSKDINKVMDILKDLLFYPIFSPDEIEIERRLVKARIKDEEDDIFDIGIKLLKRNLFPVHPYGRDILGSPKAVDNIVRQDLLDFHERFFVPNNMVIAVYGDIDIDATKRIFAQCWADLKPREIEIKLMQEPPHDKARNVKEGVNKKQALILMGFQTVTRYDPDRYALDLVSGILSGEGGLLYEEIRQKFGFSYMQGAASSPGIDRGYFIVYTATTEKDVDNVKEIIANIIRGLKNGNLSDPKIEDAKRYLLGKRLRDMEVNSSLALKTSIDELMGLGFNNFEEYEDKINKITKDDIMRACQKYLNIDTATIIEIISKEK